MPHQLPPWVWPVTLTVVCALALWRGGPDERRAAALVAVDWLCTYTIHRTRSEDAQWADLGIDTVLFVLLAALALRSARHWPLATAALALLIMMTHLLNAADPRVSGWAYQTLLLVWSYLCLATVAYGCLARRRA